MKLDEDQRAEIRRRLQRSNRRIWDDGTIPHVYGILDQMREGNVKRKDWFIPDMVTYEDYVLQLNLTKFM